MALIDDVSIAHKHYHKFGIQLECSEFVLMISYMNEIAVQQFHGVH